MAKELSVAEPLCGASGNQLEVTSNRETHTSQVISAKKLTIKFILDHL